MADMRRFDVCDLHTAKQKISLSTVQRLGELIFFVLEESPP